MDGHLLSYPGSWGKHRRAAQRAVRVNRQFILSEQSSGCNSTIESWEDLVSQPDQPLLLPAAAHLPYRYIADTGNQCPAGDNNRASQPGIVGPLAPCFP